MAFVNNEKYALFSSDEFNSYTREAGAGGLAIAIEGPAKAEIDFFDRKDGSCGVSFVCPEPGEYQVSIKFNDEHIPDSPFNVVIGSPFGDAKKLTIHSLQSKGHEVNRPCMFTVNVNGARGRLDARVTAPSGAEDTCIVQEMGDGNETKKFYKINFVFIRTLCYSIYPTRKWCSLGTCSF
jgi:filamin